MADQTTNPNPSALAPPVQDYSHLAQAWQGFSADRRAGLLKKMSPEQKRGLRTVLEGHLGSSSSTSAPAPAPASDFTSNPKGEGLYRMSNSQPEDAWIQQNEVQVPYSKVEDAQAAGYKLHPDDDPRYSKDKEGEGKGPSTWEQMRAGFIEGTAPIPDTPITAYDPAHPIASTWQGLNDAAFNIEKMPANAIGRLERGIVGLASLPQQAYEIVKGIHEGNQEALLPLESLTVPGLLGSLSDSYKKDVKELGPTAALSNLIGDVATLYAAGKIGGKIHEGGTRTVEKMKSGLPESMRQTAQTTVGAGERQVKAHVIGEAEKANTAADTIQESNKTADEKTLQDRAKIDETNRQARLATKGQAVAAQKAANAREPFLAGDEVETSARQAHDEVVDRQKTIETKRQGLSDALEQSRQVVYQRLQNMKSAARAYFGQAYADIEKAGGGKGVELETLVGDAEEAREHVKGSEDSLKVFNDLEHRYNHPDVDLSKPPNSDISKEEWSTFSKEDREHAWKDALDEEGAGSTISLENLNGYYSELGRVASSKSTPGDLKSAAKAMQKSIDDRIKETYGEELFKQNQLVRSQYREFAGQFLDADSPVARAVDAPDYYHGTQASFLDKDARQPAVRSRVKTMLIGDAKDPSTQFLGKEVAETYERDPETGKMVAGGNTMPAWRYRRQTHQAIEYMRDLQKGLDALPTSEKLAKEVADSETRLAAARETARAAATAKPAQKPYSEPHPNKPITVPELNTRLIRDKFITEKLAQWTSVSKFQLARLVAGPIGIVIGAATGHPWLEVGASIYTGSELTPFALQNLLDRPGVREWFTRPPADEINALQKVPYADRVRIADGMRGMVREADKQGKPLRLSPSVISFIVANGSAREQRKKTEQAASVPVSIAAPPSQPNQSAMPGAQP